MSNPPPHTVELLGTVISAPFPPSTTTFSFVVNNPMVRKHQFVKVEGEDGVIFGVVIEIERMNRYFEHAESIAEYEKVSPLENSFPVDRWECVVGRVAVLGTFSDGLIRRNIFPAKPGAKVAISDPGMLTEFLGFDETGLNVGTLLAHDLPVKLNLSRVFQKHLAILAMSGAGKSYLTSVLIEEILERKPEHGRIALVLIDLHGEYKGLAHSYKDNVLYIDARKIRVSLRKIKPAMLYEWMPNLNGGQKRELEIILKELKEQMKASQQAEGLDKLIEILADKMSQKGSKAKTYDVLYSHFKELSYYKLVDKSDSPPVIDIVKPGVLTIIDLSNIDSYMRKQMLVSYLSHKLFALRKKKKIPPAALIIEEAHNFAREKAKREIAIAKHMIETIAREGRKFGLSLCLITQRPMNLSTTALSQCSTNIILRVTNPNDLYHIKDSCEGIDEKSLGAITTLRVGEALVVGEATNYPIFLKVRKRKSHVLKESQSLESMAKEFETSDKKETDELTEAFL